jgi:hypothetical protein
VFTVLGDNARIPPQVLQWMRESKACLRPADASVLAMRQEADELYLCQSTIDFVNLILVVTVACIDLGNDITGRG